MSPLIIPQEALASKERFEDWCLMTSNQLFPYDQAFVNKFEIEKDDQKVIELFESLLKSANFVYNNDNSVIEYRVKKRKLNCYKSDIMSIAIYLIRSYYNISYPRLGQLLGMNHATVIHHFQKQAALNNHNKKNKIKYLRLLKYLQDEKIIPITQENRTYSKWSLSPVLPGQK